MCGMHVHVEVADDARGRPGDRRDPAVAAAADRDQRELAVLGGARHRLRQLAAAGCGAAGPRPGPESRSATSRPTARWPTGSIAWGGAMDPAMLYFDARLVRELPDRRAPGGRRLPRGRGRRARRRARPGAGRDASAGEAAEPWRADLLRVAGWRAARTASPATSCTPGRASWRRRGRSSRALLEHVGAGLGRTGERRFVEDGFERLLARGNGAVRQRRTFEETARPGGGRRRPGRRDRGDLALKAGRDQVDGRRVHRGSGATSPGAARPHQVHLGAGVGGVQEVVVAAGHDAVLRPAPAPR